MIFRPTQKERDLPTHSEGARDLRRLACVAAAQAELASGSAARRQETAAKLQRKKEQLDLSMSIQVELTRGA